MPRYRPNVAALIVNLKGELLICERRNTKNGWQFPQGGMRTGESVLEALEREVKEEVGLKPKQYRVLEMKTGYRYDYPPKVAKKKGWAGQKQTYFLCKLKKETSTEIVLGKNNLEFCAYTWVKPEDFDPAWLPHFKLEVYQQVMRDFFKIELIPAPSDQNEHGD